LARTACQAALAKTFFELSLSRVWEAGYDALMHAPRIAGGTSNDERDRQPPTIPQITGLSRRALAVGDAVLS